MKIIQILVAPENSTYQGCILGLGDDGVVYVCGKGEAVWSVYIPKCGSKECCGGDMENRVETAEMRMRAVEADALSMALRLLGEDESTFSPDVAEVMDRWLNHFQKHGPGA